MGTYLNCRLIEVILVSIHNSSNKKGNNWDNFIEGILGLSQSVIMIACNRLLFSEIIE